MNVKRRILSALLALCMVLTWLPAAALAAASPVTSGTCGPTATWNFDSSNGTLTISGTGSMTDFSYSASSGSSSPWYAYHDVIKTVTIADGITSIGNRAFADHEALTSVGVIPDSVTKIGEGAFYGCFCLNDIVLPSGITAIEPYTFMSCDFPSIIIPDSVTRLGTSAFDSCSKLKEITIPNGVTSVEDWVFADCTSLSSVTLSDNITNIKKWAFSGCSSLPSVDLPNNVTVIGAFAFWGCTSLGSITISESLNKIEESAFSQCGNLKHVSYAGTKEDWNKISIEPDNDALKKAYNNTALDKEPISIHEAVERINDYLSRVQWEDDDIIAVHVFEDEAVSVNSSEVLFTLRAETKSAEWTGQANVAIGTLCLNLLTLDGYYFLGLDEDNKVTFSLKEPAPVDPLVANHIIKVDLEDLKSNYLQKDLTIRIYFDQELSEATNESQGFIQVWVDNNGVKELKRTIHSINPNNGDSSLVNSGNFSVNESDSKCLEVSIENSIFRTWNTEMAAIPYSSKLYISMSKDSVVFQDSTILFHGVSAGASEEFSVETKWGLTPDIDFLKFKNNLRNVEFGGFDCKHWEVSPAMALALLKQSNFPPLVDLSLLGLVDIPFRCKVAGLLYFDEWNGSCRGMCSVVALKAIGALDLNAWDPGADICYKLSSPMDSTSAFGTQDLINYYQIIQYFKVYPYYGESVSEQEKWNNMIQTIVEKAKAFQESKTPLIIGMDYNDKDNKTLSHACLAYAFEEQNDKYILYLYNPSSPNQAAKGFPNLEISKKDNRVTFNESAGLFFSYNLIELGYTDPNDLKRYNLDQFVGLLKTKDSSPTGSYQSDDKNSRSTLYVGINNDCTISNSLGEYLICNNGKLNGTMNLYSKRTIGEGLFAEYCIEVDKSEQFICKSESEGMDFSVGQDNFYLSAVSTSSNVEVKVIPGNSSVLSNLAGGKVDYQILSSINSSDAEVVVVKGQSQNPVTISYTDKGQIKLSSDDVSSAKVSILQGVEVVSSKADPEQNGLIILNPSTSPNPTAIPTATPTLYPSTPDRDDSDRRPVVSRRPSQTKRPSTSASPKPTGSISYVPPTTQPSPAPTPVPTQGASQIFADVSPTAWYTDAVKFVYGKGIMQGTSRTEFSPDVATNRAMAVTVLYRMQKQQVSGTEKPFSDVDYDQWYTNPIIWASSNGIVQGYGNGTFGPNDLVTREQVATILYRFAQWSGMDTWNRTDFSGYVDANEISPYATEAMRWAVAKGLINGTSTITLSPHGNASRAEIATMLMRFCGEIVV